MSKTKLKQLRALPQTEFTRAAIAELESKRDYNREYMRARRANGIDEDPHKHSERMRQWRRDHPDDYKQVTGRRNLKNVEQARDMKRRAISHLGGQCSDCQAKVHDAAFDFHHVNHKGEEISKLIRRGRSWEQIVQELDKCVLLCSNCHRTRHANMIE